MGQTTSAVLNWHAKRRNIALSNPGIAGALQAYQRGGRLKEAHFSNLATGLLSAYSTSPAHIIRLIDRETPNSQGRSLAGFFYYASTGAELKTATREKFTPSQQLLGIAGDFCQFTARTWKQTARQLPITLDSEAIEYEYLRHTGELFSFTDGRTAFMTGFCLTLIRAYAATLAPEETHATLKIPIPYGPGFLLAYLEPDSAYDTRYMNVIPAEPDPHRIALNNEELRLGIKIVGFLNPARMPQPMAALHQMFRSEFRLDDASNFLEDLKAYQLGITMPDPLQLSEGQKKINALIQHPLWLGFVHRNGQALAGDAAWELDRRLDRI